MDRYALFTTTKKRDWSISEKLDLYRAAVQAFDSAADERSRRRHFDRIYRDLKRWWGIARNGSLAAPETIFALLTDECGACSRISGMTLMDVQNRCNQAAVVECLRKVRVFKKLKSDDYPVMAVSKFLHFFNPRLFVIWDRAVVLEKVYGVFRRDWDSSYRDIKVPTDDNWMKFYLAYLLWAGKAIHAHGLMDGFATWFVEAVSSEPEAEDFRQELKHYYATAFEFIAIGSALLENKGNGCGSGRRSNCPRIRQARRHLLGAE